MTLQSISAFFAACAFFCAAQAAAASVTTFDFQASATAGANSIDIGPDFPSGGLAQIDSGPSPLFLDPTSYASVVGNGDVDPLTFAAAASAAGDASATIEYLVTVVIENDATFAREVFLKSGLATPTPPAKIKEF
ncbi:MAG: hypothetical protein AAGJ87_15915, partial [Pseudomonadota bacterium]